jgi:hypothetical protein
MQKPPKDYEELDEEKKPEKPLNNSLLEEIAMKE